MARLDQYLREVRPTLTLALPIIVGQLSNMLMGAVDSVMIGRTGTVPLAASSFGTNVFNIFYVLGIGFMVPVAIFVSRSRGAGRPTEAAEYLRHGLATGVGFGVIMTLVMGVLSWQLERFDQPPEVVAIVRPFFLLIAASLTPTLLYLVLREYAESMGHPWAPMFIALGSVALNAVLNWVLIYGNLGAPALGLTGAGIATLIARIVNVSVIFLWLRADPKVRDAWPRAWFAPLSGARFKEMLRVGLPAAGMLLFESSAFAFSSIMNGWLGAVPLAAHQIAISTASMAFMVPLGLAMANGMRVSHAVGSGERDRLRPIAFATLGIGITIMVVFALGLGLGGRVIATWYVTDPAVISLAAQLMIVAALFQLFDGTQVIAASSLRAIMDVRIPAIITCIAYWGVALPLGYIIGVRGPFGAVGVWSGIASGLALAAIFMTWRFVRLTRVR
ncbi:MAG TPA: MATE family efflux transporter [Opitutaceae bacterium]